MVVTDQVTTVSVGLLLVGATVVIVGPGVTVVVVVGAGRRIAEVPVAFTTNVGGRPVEVVSLGPALPAGGGSYGGTCALGGSAVGRPTPTMAITTNRTPNNDNANTYHGGHPRPMTPIPSAYKTPRC